MIGSRGTWEEPLRALRGVASVVGVEVGVGFKGRREEPWEGEGVAWAWPVMWVCSLEVDWFPGAVGGATGGAEGVCGRGFGGGRGRRRVAGGWRGWAWLSWAGPGATTLSAVLLQAPAAWASPPAPRLSLPLRPRTWRTRAWTPLRTRRLAPRPSPGSPAPAPRRAPLAAGRRPPRPGPRDPRRRPRTRRSPSRASGGWRPGLEVSLAARPARAPRSRILGPGEVGRDDGAWSRSTAGSLFALDTPSPASIPGDPEGPPPPPGVTPEQHRVWPPKIRGKNEG